MRWMSVQHAPLLHLNWIILILIFWYEHIKNETPVLGNAKPVLGVKGQYVLGSKWKGSKCLGGGGSTYFDYSSR